MNLTHEEKSILKGEKGYALQKAMQILVALGKTYNAKHLIPIKSAHIAGVSYKGLGDAGLEFLETLANEFPKVKVPTTMNPGGASPEMKVPGGFMQKQRRIIAAYQAMGITPTLTCTPYYVGNSPQKGDHIAWAESSAVVYANSVLGAYTNREGGPSALAAALIGKTPEYGMHLDKNRKPSITIEVKGKIRGVHAYAAVGYYAGKNSGSKVINFLFEGVQSKEELKGLSAALAASGAVPMFTLGEHTKETIQIGEKEINEVFEEFTSSEQPDLVCVGCPHASAEEIKQVSRMLKGRQVKGGVTFWIFTSKEIKKEAEDAGWSWDIEAAGAKLITDTCMVVAPLETLGFKVMATNSAKAAHYARSLCNLKTKLMSLEEIAAAATK